MFSDRTQFSSPSSPSSSSASSADDVPNRPTDADAAADSFYMDLEAVGGVHWSKAETSFLRFKGAQRTRIFTLPEFPPGFEQASFPTTLPELGVRASCSEQRVRFKTELLSAFDASIQSEDWAYALRCAIAAEIVRRTARIHAARGEPAVSEFGAHGGLYHAERALPAPPRELRPIFHGIDYGSSPRELAFMQAVGVQPIAGRVAGFECVDPIHVVVRTRNAKTKRYVNVPAVVAKASVSEYDDPTPLEVLVRRCRRLVAECEACDSSPLCLLDLQVLACIPSGRIRLPAPGGAAVHYEHLYGAVNDTRRFWLTSYHTDRLQYPCALVAASVLAPLRRPPLEPARVACMAARRGVAAREERAMFQAMYTVWGIDRMTVGRAFAWREAPSLDHDDLTFVEEAGVYPQWLPQGLPFVDPGTRFWRRYKRGHHVPSRTPSAFCLGQQRTAPSRVPLNHPPRMRRIMGAVSRIRC